MKKINGVTSLATALLFLCHCTCMSLLMLGIIPFAPWIKLLGRGVAALFCLHALFSIIVFFFVGEHGNAMQYPKKNMGTIIQRIDAIIMLILIHVHANVYGTGQAPATLLIIPEIIFLVAAFDHTLFSVPKALITLNITKSAAAQKRSQLFSGIICGAVGLFTLASLLIYFF